MSWSECLQPTPIWLLNFLRNLVASQLGIASAATELELGQTSIDLGQMPNRGNKTRTSQLAYERSCELSPLPPPPAFACERLAALEISPVGDLCVYIYMARTCANARG